MLFAFYAVYFFITNTKYSHLVNDFFSRDASRLEYNKVSCPRTQRSASGETRTRDPLISSRALYHGAIALLILIYSCRND